MSETIVNKIIDSMIVGIKENLGLDVVLDDFTVIIRKDNKGLCYKEMHNKDEARAFIKGMGTLAMLKATGNL